MGTALARRSSWRGARCWKTAVRRRRGPAPSSSATPITALSESRQSLYQDLASDLLDAYFRPDPDDARKYAAWIAAEEELGRLENPRIEAAFELVRTMTELQNVATPAEVAALDSVIAVADQLRHLPTRAMLRLVKASQVFEQRPSSEAAELFEAAIRYLAPLAAFEPSWNGLLSGARRKLALQRAGEEGMEIKTHMPPGEQDDGQMRAIMEALMGAQQAVAEEYGHVTVRDVEAGLDDILWNAVVMGHPNRFEDIPESVTFADQVALKLEHQGFIPASAKRFATPMLAGLLRHLWDSQNLMYLSPDMAEGQTAAMHALVEDIRANWSPPDGKAWYAIAEPAPRLVDEVLTFIEKLKWEEVYQHLNRQMDALAKSLKAILAKVQASYPDALGSCAAFVSGVVMTKNTFSPLDGSVPEDIGEQLTKVYHELEEDNESRFFGYLKEGFEKVAQRPPDELSRWRMEPEAGPVSRASKRATKARAKTGRAGKRGRGAT